MGTRADHSAMVSFVHIQADLPDIYNLLAIPSLESSSGVGITVQGKTTIASVHR